MKHKIEFWIGDEESGKRELPDKDAAVIETFGTSVSDYVYRIAVADIVVRYIWGTDPLSDAKPHDFSTLTDKLKISIDGELMGTYKVGASFYPEYSVYEMDEEIKMAETELELALMDAWRKMIHVRQPPEKIKLDALEMYTSDGDTVVDIHYNKGNLSRIIYRPENDVEYSKKQFIEHVNNLLKEMLKGEKNGNN